MCDVEDGKAVWAMGKRDLAPQTRGQLPEPGDVLASRLDERLPPALTLLPLQGAGEDRQPQQRIGDLVHSCARIHGLVCEIHTSLPTYMHMVLLATLAKAAACSMGSNPDMGETWRKTRLRSVDLTLLKAKTMPALARLPRLSAGAPRVLGPRAEAAGWSWA